MVAQNPSVLHTTIAHVAKPTVTGAHTHTQYIINVSDERSPGLNWTVFRRYSEFRVLRLRLEEAVKAGDMCGHCTIMSKRTCFMQFPHRKWFNNTKESTLETRRVGLNAFLDAVAKHARTCKESMTCQTRPLMDQFLMVNDMRYSFLNVQISEQEAEQLGKSVAGLDDKLATTPVNARGSGVVATDFTNSNNNLQSAAPSRLNRLSSRNQQSARGSSGDCTIVPYTSTTAAPATEVDNRVMAVKTRTMPNLLSYAAERRSRTHSCDSDGAPARPRPNSLSSWENVVYQPQAAGRFSDPGAAPVIAAAKNDLLSFSRGSFGGGGSTSGVRRSDQRARARKVHLSSAAKRVKKLEEQEARFHSQTVRRAKQVLRLTTITE